MAAQGFQTLAPHAILIDSDTGTVLFEKAADELVAPASMAKLMTVEVLFNEIKQGRLKLDSEFVISENAWRRGGGPSGGSSMFAEAQQPVKLSDLLRGIIVQSGNDACDRGRRGHRRHARTISPRMMTAGRASSACRSRPSPTRPATAIPTRR